MSTTTAATTIVLQLAREILSRHRPSPPSSSSRKAEEVPALFGRLAKSLRESTEAHVRTSMVPRRVPPTTTTTNTTTTNTTANVITTNDGRIEWRNHFRDAVTASLARCSHDPSPPSRDNTRAPLSSANATYGETPPDTIRALLAALSSAPYSSNDNNTSSSSSNSRNNSSNSNNSISNSNKNSNNKNNTHRSFEGSFIDAGSGNGIATVCAASTGHFHLCRGVEYSEGRHVLAMGLRDDYIRQCSGRSDNHDNNDDNNNNSNNDIDNNNDNDNDSVRNQTQIEFTCGDLANETFHGSSLIFANCVVWDASLCSAVGRNIDEARMVGPRLVATISRRFPSPSFDLVDILTLPCNGGEDFTFYVCQKSGYHDLGGDIGSSFALAANDAVVVVGTATSAAATNKSPNTTTATSTNNNNSNNNNIDHRDSFALSDSQPMRALRREIGLLEELVGISILSRGPNNNNDNTNNEGMAFLAAMGASEPSARVLLDNQDILPHLAKKLLLQSNYHNGDGDAGAGIHGGIINSLATRASSSMALRALSDFPIGRRRIAEDKSVVAALMGSLAVEVKGPCIPGGSSSSSSSGSGNKNDHPAIRANVLDVLGQILNDPVGFKSVLGVHSDINALLVNVRRDAKFNGWSDVVESCDEMQTKLGWWDTINLQDLEL